jgi:hypothetical protein
MDSNDLQSTLTDNLLVLPRWATGSAVGLLAAGVLTGLALLLAPHLASPLRTAGGDLLVVSLPTLALTIGLLGTSWARTERIDLMIDRYLRGTVGDKLEARLVGDRLEARTVRDKGVARESRPYPSLFVRMERHSRKELTSYCVYRLFDDQGRRFDIYVKSNVFNFEVGICLHLTARSARSELSTGPHKTIIRSLDDKWSDHVKHPLVELVGGTLYGSLAEGYSVYVNATPEAHGGWCVMYTLRQKLENNFLTSPYLRRYFAEDASIASYFFYAEAFANDKFQISGGEQ